MEKIPAIQQQITTAFEAHPELRGIIEPLYQQMLDILVEHDREMTKASAADDFDFEVEGILKEAKARTDALLEKYKTILPPGF
jgi:hypothetical protein